VSGYVVPEEGEAGSSGPTAWAEALTPGLGWIAFDPARKQCADARYVRVAVGFDQASAAPFRTAHMGGAVESVDSALRIGDARALSQSQGQRQGQSG